MVTWRGLQWGLALALTVGLAGCGGDGVVVPEGGDPFLYLVLNERTADQVFAGTVGQHALLVTVRSAVQTPVYRSAERFEMREAGTDGLFGWRQFEAAGLTVGSFPALSIRGWNFHLPDSAPGQLTADDLEPGKTYSLLMETEGVSIRGTTTIPDTFSVRTSSDTESTRLIWPSVTGAAGYRIEVPDREVRIQTDTLFRVPQDVSPAQVTIVALDDNLFRYSTDPELSREGIDRGLGVFGAISIGR